MPNATSGSVIFVDTTAYQGVGKCYISAIRYIGAAGGTAVLKTGGAGGTTVWEESGTANTQSADLGMAVDDIHVILTNSAKIYIYTSRR